MRRLVFALFLSTALSLPAMAAESSTLNPDERTALSTQDGEADFSTVPEQEEQVLLVPVSQLPARWEHAIEIRPATKWDLFGTIWRKVATEVPATHQRIEVKAGYLRAKFVPLRLRKLDFIFNRT